MTRRSHGRGSQTHVGLEQRFVESARALQLDPGQQVILGFSGGKDSLALARLFSRAKRFTGIQAHLVHVNHNLRADSGEEARRAEALANSLELPFSRVDLESGVVTRHPGVGIEEAARRERYLALSRLAAKEGINLVALAHHQSDQAETVLLHLIYGAGLSGISAMTKLAAMTVPWWAPALETLPILVWRPLLEEDPSLLADYAHELGLAPVLDPSNDDPDFLRNAIRHRVLPLIEELRPGSTRTIARHASAAAPENEYIERLASVAASEVVVRQHRIDRHKAGSLDRVVLRRVLRTALSRAGLEMASRERTARIVELIFDDPGIRIIELEGGIAIADRHWLYFGTEAEVWREFADVHKLFILASDSKAKEPIVLNVGGIVEIGDYAISAREAREGPAGCGILLPRSLFNNNVELRRLQPGDIWAKSRRPLNEWLRLQGVPAAARSRMLAIASNSGVLAVPFVASPEEEDLKSDQVEENILVEILGKRRGDQC